jgi:bifunctional UDP-N-acetylglucosamine pyrophosphorylase/glucosamine-1-phosphate N-acetyltransferase
MTTNPGSAPLERTSGVVLAAGQGTRMKSAIPKVLHIIAGRPLVHYPVHAALEAGCEEVVVVVGHGRAEVLAYLRKTFGDRVRIAVQEEQRGTGDAARVGLEAVSAAMARAILFYGDVPLLAGDDLRAVARALDAQAGAVLALATCTLDDPTGYGRVLRDGQGRVVEIREQKDLRTNSERAVREINPGIYAAPVSFLREAVAGLSPNNAQGELYLTDIVAYASSSSRQIVACPSRAEVLVGVNDRQQLMEAEEAMYARIARAWRIAGVTVHHGARIEDGVELAPDAVVERGAVLRGTTRIGSRAAVGIGCVLTNVTVADEAVILPYSVLTDSAVGARAQVGPFSHLRPESDIGEEAHVGNFVETKKTRLAKGAKANHLSYLGDGVIGERANIGAGTIFCNYDGFMKHTTTIGAGAFVGSDSQLVAPVHVGDGAYIATGTTVTRDVPPNALALSRVKQENKEGYADKLKARLQSAKAAAAKKSG